MIDVQDEVTRIISSAQKAAGSPPWVRWLLLSTVVNSLMLAGLVIYRLASLLS